MNNKIKLEELIYQMLLEDTGVACCDSGGDSNRNWQRNQSKSIEDFRAEPVTTHEYDEMYSISTFHYLTANDSIVLDKLSTEFNNMFSSFDDWNTDVYGISEYAQQWLLDAGAEFCGSWNSFNWNNVVDQVLQGTYLKIGDRDYVLLQIHGGADVRGGYTDAKLFYLPYGYMVPEDVTGKIIRADGSIVAIEGCDGLLYYAGTGDLIEVTDGDEVKLTSTL